MGTTEGEKRAYSQRLHQIRTTERHKWMHENVCMQSTYSCRDYIERQRDIITMAMPTIESVPKHDLLEQQIIFYTKTAMLNTTTAKLYGQSHKSGINYFNCIWLVFGARLSPENGGWENEREREERKSIQRIPVKSYNRIRSRTSTKTKRIERGGEKTERKNYGSELCTISDLCVPSDWIKKKKIGIWCVSVCVCVCSHGRCHALRYCFQLVKTGLLFLASVHDDLEPRQM